MIAQVLLLANFVATGRVVVTGCNGSWVGEVSGWWVVAEVNVMC